MTVANFDRVHPPRRRMAIHPAIVVVLLRATLCFVGVLTLVVLAPGSGNFPTALAHTINVLQTQVPILSRGNPALPEIALTFDDGPNPPYTLRILAILKHFGIKATFFCIGRQVARYPEIVKQEYAAGNTIGDHTWSHPFLTSLSASQIFSQLDLTARILQKTIGVRPLFFRPPYGALNATVLAQANLLKLTTTLWSDDPRDWTLPGTQAIISRVLSVAGNGTIILMHDGGGNRSETVAAQPTIIETLQKRGFRFITLRQLVAELHTSIVVHGAEANLGSDPRLPLERPPVMALDFQGVIDKLFTA